MDDWAFGMGMTAIGQYQQYNDSRRSANGNGRDTHRVSLRGKSRAETSSATTAEEARKQRKQR